MECEGDSVISVISGGAHCRLFAPSSIVGFSSTPAEGRECALLSLLCLGREPQRNTGGQQ